MTAAVAPDTPPARPCSPLPKRFSVRLGWAAHDLCLFYDN